MTIALLFWILMLLWLVLGIFQHWSSPPATPPSVTWLPWGGGLLLFVLLLLLGWHAFGSPIRT